jgi:long-chain fatty acid transport protein
MQITCHHLPRQALTTIAAAVLSMGVAHATDVFNLEGYGPISRAMGGTGVAYDIGAAGMMYNPATLGQMTPGKHLDLGLGVIVPDIKVRNTATGDTATSGNHGNNNGPYFAPELAFVYRRNNLALGVGAFAQGGLGTQFGSSSFLSRTTTNGVNTGFDQFSRLLVLRIPFALAYNVSDQFSVGASIDAVWTSLNLGALLDASQIGTLAMQGRASGTLMPVLLSVPGLSGGYLNFTNHGIVGGGAEAWGIGGKVGLTYQVTPKTRLGVAYNFKTAVNDLTGNASLSAVSSVAGNIPLSGSIAVQNFQMPAQLTVGLEHRVNDQWTVAADYQRVFWANVMKNLNLAFSQSGSGATLNLVIPQNYRDINVFALGTQYRYNDKWTFRGGFQYAEEAIPGNTMLAVVPAIPTTHLTGGLSYAFSKTDILNFGLAVALQKTWSNSSQPNTAFAIEAKHSQVNAVVNYQKLF